MKIGNFDLFKLFIIIFLGIFLYIYYENSDIGRFQVNNTMILDTKTGQVYLADYNKLRDYTPQF